MANFRVDNVLYSTRLHRRASSSVTKRLVNAAKAGTVERDTKKLLASIEAKIVDGAHSVNTAIANVRLAAKYLRAIGSKDFRKPRATTYEHLIVYHTTLALHEFGAWRYRMVRLFGGLQRHFEKVHDQDRARFMQDMRAAFNERTAMTELRDEHVHGEPFAPPAVVENGMQRIVRGAAFSGRSFDLANKQAARSYANSWRLMAKLLEDSSAYFFELTDLVMEPELTTEQMRRALKRIEARFPPTTTRRDTSGQRRARAAGA